MNTLQERVFGVFPPSSWRLSKLHRVLRVRKGNKNEGMKENNLLSLSYGRIIQKDIETAEGLLPESFETYQIVDPGNIVMRLTDLQNDKRSLRQGLVRERGIVTSAYDALEVGPSQDSRYWAYCLLALDLAKYYYSLGGGVRQSIKFTDFPNEWIAVPDPSTQKAIANVLDRETARIDQLIEKKQRLVDLLEEKQAALAETGVTVGLHRSVVTKQARSGFFDALPIQWNEERMRFGIRRIEQGWSPQCEERGIEAHEWGVLKLGSITTGVYREESHKALPSDLEPRTEYLVKQGDVLVARASGSPSLVGKACYVERTTKRLLMSDKHYRIQLRTDRYDPEFFVMALNSSRSRAQIENELSSAEGMARNIGQDVIREIWWAVPPIHEQCEIVAWVRDQSALIANTAARVSSSIDRLREFRSALITAAVTGQIDVATWGMKGTTDRRLEAIEETLGADAEPDREREEAAV